MHESQLVNNSCQDVLLCLWVKKHLTDWHLVNKILDWHDYDHAIWLAAFFCQHDACYGYDVYHHLLFNKSHFYNGGQMSAGQNGFWLKDMVPSKFALITFMKRHT